MNAAISIKIYLMNLLSSYLPFMIQILGALIFTPFFIRVLGTEQYGLFILVNTIIGYFSLCDIGFSQAFTFKLIDYFQKNEHEKISALISSVFYYFLFAAIAINILVGLFLALDLGIHLFDQGLYPYFKNGLLTFSLSFPAILLAQFFERILFAKNLIARVNLIKSLQQLCLLIGNILILITVKDLNYIFLNYLIINIIFCVVMVIASRRAQAYTINLSLVSKKTFSTIAGSSWWFFVGTICYLLNFQTDVFIITTFFNLEMVALYTIYYKFVHIFMMILTKPAESYIPTISAKYNTSEYTALRDTHRTFLAIILLASLIAAAFLLKPGYLFLQWWIGYDVINNFSLFIPFVIYLILFSIDNVSSTFLWAMCRHKKSVLMGLLNGSLNLALSIIFSHYMGISGVIWGSIAALLLTNFWYNLYLLVSALKNNAIHSLPTGELA